MWPPVVEVGLRGDMVEVSMHGNFPIQVLGGEAAFGGNVVCHFIAMDTYVCFNFLQSDCCACLTSVKEIDTVDYNVTRLITLKRRLTCKVRTWSPHCTW